jgi:DNA (cytosine-5)-methyltransferase 1
MAFSKTTTTSPKGRNRRPIGIDLFAGAGGLSLGFEQAGFDIAAAVEIDPIHCATHEHNFPHTKTICASVVNLSGKEIRERSRIGEGEIDVVFGGAPCQGFSMIGKRAMDDPRNQLVFHYVRLVKELRPKYFVFENVKGLTVGRHAEFLQELIAAMHKAGYEVKLPYRVLNAADYGVPQDRRRLFLIGAREGLTLPEYPAKIEAGTTVWEAIGDLPDADRFEALNESDSVPAKWKTKSHYARRLRGLEPDPEDFSHVRQFDPDVLTASMRTKHTPLSQERFMATEHGKTEPVSRFLKLPPDGLCNTLRAGTDSARGAFTSPRPIHPFLPRVITVREAARLHSYPDWFRFHSTKWHGFRQIGNSVPPLLGRAVASEIVKALGVTPSKPKKAISSGDSRLLTLDMGGAALYFQVSRHTIAQRTRKKDSRQAELSI